MFLVCAPIWEGCALFAAAIVRRLTPGWRGTLVGMIAAPTGGSPPAIAATMLAIEHLAGATVAFLSLYGQSLLLALAACSAWRGARSGRLAPFPVTGTDRRPRAASLWPRPDPPRPHPSPPSIAPMPIAAFLSHHAPAGIGQWLLALLRLRDAIGMLGQAAGWQPHRSFWLPAEVRSRAERCGQSRRLVLENGLVAPVSRGALPAMRAAGFGGAQPAPSRASMVGSTAE